jgi:hypothetical protein
VGRGCLPDRSLQGHVSLTFRNHFLKASTIQETYETAAYRHCRSFKRRMCFVRRWPDRGGRDRPDQHSRSDQERDDRCDRALKPAADFLLIDALTLKAVSASSKAIIKGDAISASIAAHQFLQKLIATS